MRFYFHYKVENKFIHSSQKIFILTRLKIKLSSYRGYRNPNTQTNIPLKIKKEKLKQLSFI